MPKLYSSSHVLKVLKKQGFVVTGGKGSHVKLKNKKLKRITVVPDKRKQIPLGTFFAILSQTGLSPYVFEKKL